MYMCALEDVVMGLVLLHYTIAGAQARVVSLAARALKCLLLAGFNMPTRLRL